LCRWRRFLPPPGAWAAGKPNFEEILEKEAVVMNRINVRYNDLGGMTSEISKRIGHKNKSGKIRAFLP
jgi:hypothetical protein